MDESSNKMLAVVKFVTNKYNEPNYAMKELSSFEDTNILIQSTKQSTDPKPDHTKLVLKIFSSTNEASESFTTKIECVKYLSTQHFLCSKFLLGVDGNYVQTFPESGPFENRSAVLYSFIDGKELEYTGYVNFPVVISELGSLLAHFHTSLKNIPQQSHKEDLVPDSDDPWSLHNYRLLLEDNCADIVKDDLKKEILSAAMAYVLKTLNSCEDLLTKDILHGDFHGLNVIVGESYNPSDRSQHSLFTKHSVHNASVQCSKTSASQEVQLESLKTLADSVRNKSITTHASYKDLLSIYGLIDFEEMLYSYTVLEVGRFIADVMVVYIVQCIGNDGESATGGYHSKKDCASQREFTDISTELSEASKDYLLAVGGYVMTGYLIVNELSPVDLKCIYPAMLVSLCQYYILGTRAALDPSLCESYVSYCSREAIMLLEFFHHLDSDVIINQWLEVAKGMLQNCVMT